MSGVTVRYLGWEEVTPDICTKGDVHVQVQHSTPQDIKKISWKTELLLGVPPGTV